MTPTGRSWTGVVYGQATDGERDSFYDTWDEVTIGEDPVSYFRGRDTGKFIQRDKASAL